MYTAPTHLLDQLRNHANLVGLVYVWFWYGHSVRAKLHIYNGLPIGLCYCYFYFCCLCWKKRPSTPYLFTYSTHACTVHIIVIVIIIKMASCLLTLKKLFLAKKSLSNCRSRLVLTQWVMAGGSRLTDGTLFVWKLSVAARCLWFE